MKHKTRIKDSTYLDDISGLKIKISKQLTIQEVYFYEARNITKAILKYLFSVPDRKISTFKYD